ncbi:radical SAM protein [Candidatus Kryptobacter tengchongensis]|uniref:Pyruvate formate lyase activating enzyme n=1 Tax=Kryptobacter tengchongensis TaxID=1643429 RepID=A0A656DAR1_KRYT1|nr:radical SAM protein [Candidatus Kryptobacter tengchongensis]CUS90759.1 pyruvate formate lyase activating enzyme [Candidatus Kryptobacter tengchongensis]CUT05207.1 pyruvate formate lyase activating enzyme [Candidatus Kryptobacter tengchongensis]
MNLCRVCGEEKLVSKTLNACIDCIRKNKNDILSEILNFHAKTRREFNLPEEIPNSDDGIECKICGNECRIPKYKFGYCGLRLNDGTKISHIGGTSKAGLIHWYFDPLPTNCVASWVCEGSKQYGKKNLAVFYQSCSFNCLFCQNWHFREINIKRARKISAEELADVVDKETFCICYFGGDPSTQIIHAIQTSKIAIEKKGKVRICWETNGNMNKKFLEIAVKLSLESGGCIKFDLKAYDENLNIALCGVSNRKTLENFKFACRFIDKRPEPPLVIASTLIIPGYIDADEVYKIAKFIRQFDENIPYSLLAFYPQFYFYDLPTTSRKLMNECVDAARSAGLKRVHVGNVHLLN